MKYTSFTNVLKYKLKALGFIMTGESVDRHILTGTDFGLFDIDYKGLKYVLMIGIRQRYEHVKPWHKVNHKDNGKLMMDFWCTNEASHEHDEIISTDNIKVSLMLNKLLAGKDIVTVMDHFEPKDYLYKEKKK